MKKQLFFGTTVFVFAGLLFLTGCPGIDDPIIEGLVDTTALSAKITVAEAENNATPSSLDGEDVPLGSYWVTSTVKTAFVAEIAAAKAARNAAVSQSIVNSALTRLNTAIETFKAAKQAGGGNPVNKTDLNAKITEAETLKENTEVNTSSANVALGAHWVTQTVMDTFDQAITSAKNTRDTATTQPAVDTATSTLEAAITVFEDARQTGTKTSGFTATQLNELIARANTVKSGVTPAANGDDVSPSEYWVTQTNLDTLNTAITNAQTAAASGNNDAIDSAYLALVDAINTFEDAKQLGSTPDRAALEAAIRAADTAKTGVGEHASASEAPNGSSWATTAQWAPFNTAYNNAVAVLNNSNATKNQVAAAIAALTGATSTFSTAVTGNGPGTYVERTVFSITVGELLGEYAEILFPSSGTSITMNALISALTEGEMDYAAFVLDIGFDLYKNEALTQKFSGTDTININTVFYSEFPLEVEIPEVPDPWADHDTISGTITLTGIPNPPPKVFIRAEWYNSATYETLSSSKSEITGITGTTATNIKWSIPIFEDDGFVPGDYNEFYLWIEPAGGNGGFEIAVTTAELVTINSLPANVGSLGSVAVASVTVSGTITVTYDKKTVPRVEIGVPLGYSNKPVGYTTLNSPAAGASWSVSIPRPTSEWTIWNIIVIGYDNNGDELFYEWYSVSVTVGTTGQTGIFLNVGDIDNPFNPHDVTPLTLGQWENGHLYYSDEAWYSFTAVANQTYYVWWNDSDNYEGDVDVRVAAYYSNGKEIFDEDNYYTNTESFVSTSAGTVYIRVYSDGSGDFGIAYTTVNSRPGDVFEVPSDVTPLTAGKWTSGYLYYDEAWYSFTATAQQTYYIWCGDSDNDNDGDCDISIAAYYSNGEGIFDDDNWDWPNKESKSFVATSAGTVYIKVYTEWSSGDFSIGYTTTNTRPTN